MDNIYSWQNLTWIIFHKVTLNTNHEFNYKYEEFFDCFRIIIPCSICRNNYNDKLNSDNLSVKNNYNNLFNWTIDLHNSVNNKTGKPSWDHDKARQYYLKLYLSSSMIKSFLFNYIRYNYLKGPLKTEKLISMISCFIHIIPRHGLRNNLVQFYNKFNLNRENFKKWISAALLINKKFKN